MSTTQVQGANADGSFSMSSRRLERGILIAIRGDVDLATAPVMDEQLRRAEQSEELVVLDLGEVSFMDSTGLRTVILADQRLRERGASLQLVRLPRQVVRLLALVGAIEHLNIADRVDGQAVPVEGD
jgi:anti-anti-sigma factor